MSNKKEEERNEKIIRGLMKLPPNRKCMNCSNLCPQYVCTDFWTFICLTCSGIHREFTHRVKSISMSKFTTQEVEALQKGGNQRAREMFLKGWDMQSQSLPDSSDIGRTREFIKNVYIDKKYVGGRSFDKPPRDTQNHKYSEEEYRRPSSYHSFSQSPPYEHQYEDRRYGKQSSTLTRKPGSERGHFSRKLSSFFSSPGRAKEHRHEDKIANEASDSRFSNFSVSSAGDTQRSDIQSPNSLKSMESASSPVHQTSSMSIEDSGKMPSAYDETYEKKENMFQTSQRAVSFSSFGSSDSTSMSPKTGSLSESLAETSDFFPERNIESVPSSDQMDFVVPPTENEGWATFDVPTFTASTTETKDPPPLTRPLEDGIPGMKTFDAFSSVVTDNSSQGCVVNDKPSMPTDSSWNVSSHETNPFTISSSFELWDAFDDSSSIQTPFVAFPSNCQSQVAPHNPHEPVHVEMSSKPAELWNAFDDESSNGKSSGLSALNGKSEAPSHRSHETFDAGMGLKFAEGGHNKESKPGNPFDLPFDPEFVGHDVTFPDMSSLDEALSITQFSIPFPSDSKPPWFAQDPLPPHKSAVISDGPVLTEAQLESCPFTTSAQGPIASARSNPFA